MNCQAIEPYIVDYIDGTADLRTRQAIEQHLESCAACRRKLADQQAVIFQLKALPRHKAPVDLSAGIHFRIGKPAGWKKFVKTLFIPMRTKIPLELITAAVVGLIVFAVIVPDSGQQAVKDRALRPHVSENMQMREMPAPKTAESARKKGKSSAGPAPSVDGGGKAEYRSDIGLAVRVPMKGRQRERAGKSLDSRSAEKPPAARKTFSAPAAPEADGSAEYPVADPLQEAADRIQRLAEKLNGRTLSVATNDAGRITAVTVEIPTTAYKRFTDELAQIKSIRLPETMPPSPGKSDSRIRLRLLPDTDMP